MSLIDMSVAAEKMNDDGWGAGGQMNVLKRWKFCHIMSQILQEDFYARRTLVSLTNRAIN